MALVRVYIQVVFFTIARFQSDDNAFAIEYKGEPFNESLTIHIQRKRIRQFGKDDKIFVEALNAPPPPQNP